LIFERFLNPDRISMPDIDTDFCVERRDEVIRYVTEKYGHDRVAQIVTFGTMAARAAVRDAGRALGVPLPDVDRVAKLIPSGPGGLTIEQALSSIPELRGLYDVNVQIRELVDTARTIEGMARHASTHAAGVVISKGPLIEFAPLIKLGEGDVNTQYDMTWVEKIGLLKMDFLGLRNLTVMKNASDEIRRTANPDFDLERIPDDDKKTFEMLGRGETIGVFQLESEGMKRAITELRPNALDDIVAMNALYRPGPMEWIPRYIARKHGREGVTYVHPKLEPILRDTYGIAVYQESIMQIAREIAGFTMAEADELRKVMGKKLKDQVPIYREKFLAGAERNGVEPRIANEIFTFVEPFAGYGFPKAHAVAYAWIAYQTAYLKANYPLQYLSALMTSVKDKTDKLVEYIDEARKIGIGVLPPDINESMIDFTVVGDQIRFGLAAIKGVGETAVRSILDVREADGKFGDIFDFAVRVDPKHTNRRVLEALVKSGAMDSLRGNRSQLLDAIDVALDLAAAHVRERELGQVSLFGEATASQTIVPKLRALPAPSTLEMLAWERDTLGVFLSGHPLADVAEALARSGAIPIRESKTRTEEEVVTVAGLLTHVRRTLTRAQSQMLVATLEDMSGSIECLVFPKQYEELQAAFVQDRIVILSGRVRVRERPGVAALSESAPPEASLQVSAATPFARPTAEPQSPGWHLSVGRREQIDALAALCEEFPGPVPLVLHVGAESQRIERGITSSASVRKELEKIFGVVNVQEGPP
ncbi:MAG: DNA polymerase III subunit alpha, partial [Candidatus Eremiobacteraeota bacterium]|nr:DNA polymerase III subunit alpha [Candidatus Eremiobacteraeota bacterium]